MRRLWVVSGLPGSGKSTLGLDLAAALGAQLIDKDHLLEDEYGARIDIDAPTRSALSRAADRRFIESAESAEHAVLVSFWRHPGSEASSGTPTEWLLDVPDVVEVHCRCDVATAVERFTNRRRHAGHGDRRRTTDELTTQFTMLTSLGPLGVGRLIEVDTTGPVDVAAVASACAG